MEILQYTFLDNTIQNYLICAATILVLFLFKRIFSKYIAGVLFNMLKHTSWKVNKTAFFDLLVQPLEVFFMILVILISLDKLNFPQVFNFSIHKISFSAILEALGNSVIILTFVWMLLRFIDFVATTMEDNESQFQHHMAQMKMISFFKDFFKALIVVLGIILVIRFAFHQDVTKLITGLSIVGAAIALAAKESLENLIASFIIFFDKPFHIGDSVRVLNITGTVEKIGLRSTRIRTDQKTFVTVPNKQMVDSILDNLTLRSSRRVDMRLELSFTTSAGAMQDVINEVKKILAQPPITGSSVLFNDITTSACILTVEYYTAVIPIEEFNNVKQKVNLQIIQLLEEKQVKLAERKN